MKKVKEVIAKAICNVKFCEALIKDPKKALAKNGMTLSSDELEELKEILKRSYTIKGSELINAFAVIIKAADLIYNIHSELTPQWPKKIEDLIF
jgi:hypothetical protein